MIPYWRISNSLREYLDEDLTFSGLDPVTIRLKKLQEDGIFTIQQVGTDHFLAVDWSFQEGRVHWKPDFNVSNCQWLIFGGARDPIKIMAVRADLALREAPSLGISDDKRLILQNKYYLSWYLTPTSPGLKYYASRRSKLEPPAP